MKKLAFLALIFAALSTFGQGQIVINTRPTVVEPATTVAVAHETAKPVVSSPTVVVEPTTTPTPTVTATKTVSSTEPTTIKKMTVDYGRLTPNDRAKFNEYARQAQYGSVVQKNLDDCIIVSVTEVKNVPSRSGKKMTQYVVIYNTPEGEKNGFVTTDNPTSKGCEPCYIKCMAKTPGYHQGDDISLPTIESSGESHQIPKW